MSVISQNNKLSPRAKRRLAIQCAIFSVLVVAGVSFKHVTAASRSKPVGLLTAASEQSLARRLGSDDDYADNADFVALDMEGACYDVCDPFGGVLSVVGSMSGQCDCGLSYNTSDPFQVVCLDGEVTCCGDLDNAGGVFFYFIVVFFTFLSLAIICDEYFCESLEAISTALDLSDDVAGATFMAAGSSAPELFTAIVTTLITGGSEGLGTIVGSAIFNIMVIVGVTALFAGQVLEVWWFPLTRDSVMYVIAIFVMMIVMWDYKVELFEGIIMVLFYGIYIGLMVKNADITKWVEANTGDSKVKPKGEGGDAASKAAAAIMGAGAGAGAGGAAEEPRRHMNPILMPAFRTATTEESHKRREEMRKEISMKLTTAMKVNKASSLFLAKIGKKSTESGADRLGKIMGGAVDGQAAEAKVNEPASAAEEEEEESGFMGKVVDFLSIPLVILFKYTVPDCRLEKYKNYYMATFTMSIFWIGVMSFVMVDFAARAGCVMGIPGIFMGLTFIAAGTSVPDALSSVLVAKNGQGDMAVANVLGSNIFNIFLGLGLPWTLKAAIDGNAVELDEDEPIISSVLVLLLYVIVFMGVIMKAKWKLSPRVAYYFFAAHLCFIVWALLTMLDNPVINAKI